MIGYEFLLSRVPLRMPPLSQAAQVRPVTRIEELPAPWLGALRRQRSRVRQNKAATLPLFLPDDLT